MPQRNTSGLRAVYGARKTFCTRRSSSCMQAPALGRAVQWTEEHGLRTLTVLLGMQGYKPGRSGRCACDPALSPNCLACAVPGTCGPTPGRPIAGEHPWS